MSKYPRYFIFVCIALILLICLLFLSQSFTKKINPLPKNSTSSVSQFPYTLPNPSDELETLVQKCFVAGHTSVSAVADKNLVSDKFYICGITDDTSKKDIIPYIYTSDIEKNIQGGKTHIMVLDNAKVKAAMNINSSLFQVCGNPYPLVKRENSNSTEEYQNLFNAFYNVTKEEDKVPIHIYPNNAILYNSLNFFCTKSIDTSYTPYIAIIYSLPNINDLKKLSLNLVPNTTIFGLQLFTPKTHIDTVNADIIKTMYSDPGSSWNRVFNITL